MCSQFRFNLLHNIDDIVMVFLKICECISLRVIILVIIGAISILSVPIKKYIN